jgi:hypothetical protein
MEQQNRTELITNIRRQDFTFYSQCGRVRFADRDTVHDAPLLDQTFHQFGYFVGRRQPMLEKLDPPSPAVYKSPDSSTKALVDKGTKVASECDLLDTNRLFVVISRGQDTFRGCGDGILVLHAGLFSTATKQRPLDKIQAVSVGPQVTD